jgi:3D (Asp-Asp-Asp) domain-containing protein
MSKQIQNIMVVVCLAIIIQVGVTAQDSPQTSQGQSAKSSNTLSSTAHTKLTNQVAIVSDTTASKARGDVKAELSKGAATEGPKVDFKNPSIDLNIIPREAKMNERNFAGPDLEILGDPKPFRATAYALPGRTRSGVYVRRGVLAADPRVLPLGSIVHIKAGKYTGVYTVYDTGKKIKGNIVDVWVPSRREAKLFGRQRIKLHVLRFGPKNRTNLR